jgi:hypothetical protein
MPRPGSDTAAEKDLQKTRLYRRRAQANRTRITQLGYDSLWRGGVVDRANRQHAQRPTDAGITGTLRAMPCMGVLAR